MFLVCGVRSRLPSASGCESEAGLARGSALEVVAVGVLVVFGEQLPDLSLEVGAGRAGEIVTGRARFGVSMVRMEVLLDRSQNWPTVVWQKLL